LQADNQLVRNERGVVVNWLVKALIAFAIGGVILFDTGKIAINFFGLDGGVDEVANQVAQDVAAGKFTENDVRTLNSCTRRPTTNLLCTEIQQKLKEKDARLLKVTVDLQQNLKIRARRTTDTLVVKHIGPIEDWATATSEGEAELQSS
jgi:hypothetical protein